MGTYYFRLKSCTGAGNGREGEGRGKGGRGGVCPPKGTAWIRQCPQTWSSVREVDVAKSDRETVPQSGPATAKERSPRRVRVR